jgi:hypothetical protein
LLEKLENIYNEHHFGVARQQYGIVMILETEEQHMQAQFFLLQIPHDKNTIAKST